MAAVENDLEMVQRHVQQAERHVSRQLEIIAEIRLREQSTVLAERLLLNFEAALLAHRDHLSKLVFND